MDSGEKILEVTWKALLTTPVSLFVAVLCLTVGYFTYNMQKDKERYEEQARNCIEEKLKEKEVYINLLQNLKINNEFKKDSIK